MKQVKISKYMQERANKIVEALNGNAMANENNAEALAKVLETPFVNKVDSERYDLVLRATLNDITSDVVIDMDKINIMLADCVIKEKRVISPEVRKSRYEKAKAKLMKKYGIEG